MKKAIHLLVLVGVASTLNACSSKSSSPSSPTRPPISRGGGSSGETGSGGLSTFGGSQQGYQDGIDYPSWIVYGAKTFELDNDNSDTWSLIKKHQLTSIKALRFNRPIELVSKSTAPKQTNDYQGWLFIGGGRTQANTNTDSFSEGKNRDLSLILPTAQPGDSTLRYPFTPFCRISVWTDDDQKRSAPSLKIADADTAVEIYSMEAFRVQDKESREVVVFKGKGQGINYFDIECYAPSEGPVSAERAHGLVTEALKGIAVIE